MMADKDCATMLAMPSESVLCHRLAAARQARRYLVDQLRYSDGDPVVRWVDEDISRYEREISTERASHRTS